MNPRSILIFSENISLRTIFEDYFEDNLQDSDLLYQIIDLNSFVDFQTLSDEAEIRLARENIYRTLSDELEHKDLSLIFLSERQFYFKILFFS
jgi:hypothetical protein